MTMTCCRLLALAGGLLSTLGAGCGSEVTGDGAPGFSIAVMRANYADAVAALKPGAGNTYVQVQVTIRNDNQVNAVSANPAWFSVVTEGGLSVLANPAVTDLGPKPCKPLASVIAGGSITCGIAFELPRTDKPKTLRYHDESDRTATAPVDTLLPPPLLLPSGSYGLVTEKILEDGCATGLTSFAGLNLELNVSESEVVLFNWRDDQGNSLHLPRDYNSAATMTALHGLSSKGCTWDSDYQIEIVVPTSSEFDFSVTTTRHNLNGTCTGTEGCHVRYQAHYKRK